MAHGGGGSTMGGKIWGVILVVIVIGVVLYLYNSGLLGQGISGLGFHHSVIFVNIGIHFDAAWISGRKRVLCRGIAASNHHSAPAADHDLFKLRHKLIRHSRGLHRRAAVSLFSRGSAWHGVRWLLLWRILRANHVVFIFKRKRNR